MAEKDFRRAGMPGSVLTSRYEGINRTENQSSEKFKTRSLRPEGCGTRSHLCACILEMSGLKFCGPPAFTLLRRLRQPRLEWERRRPPQLHRSWRRLTSQQ